MGLNKLKKEAIIPRLDGIAEDIQKLFKLKENGLNEFRNNEEIFALSQFYLRQALEGVFHIGEHILSRLNGGRATEYKEIAKLLGEKGVVNKNFADNNLKDMAGYRNRLTHFYAEITPSEIYDILQNNLDDISMFLREIKSFLGRLTEFNLEIE